MSDLITSENTAQTMRETMERNGVSREVIAPNPDELTTPHLIDSPTHRTIHDLTHYHVKAAELFKPLRRKGTAQLTDLASLIAWANRFKGETSVLYANPDMKAPSLTCIADYHATGAPAVGTEDETARHCAHRAVYKFPISNDWRDWTRVSGTAMDKDEMGEFIEAHAHNIMDPTPAILKPDSKTKPEPWEEKLNDIARRLGNGRYGQLAELLQMSRHFAVHEKSELSVTSNRDTGEQSIQLVDEHKTPEGAPIRVPNLIIVTLPVFLSGDLYRMAVRFRYRKSGGQVKFILSIYNAEKVFEAAFDEAIDRAQHDTELPLFRGTPEGSQS